MLTLGIIAWALISQSASVQAQGTSPGTHGPSPTPVPFCPEDPPKQPNAAPTPLPPSPSEGVVGPICIRKIPERVKREAPDGSPGLPSIPGNPNIPLCLPHLGIIRADGCNVLNPGAQDAPEDEVDAPPSKAASGASAASQRDYAFVIHYMDCSASGGRCYKTATGINDLWANLTGRPPALRGAFRSWENYHYFNRIHLNHFGYSVTCPNGFVYPEFISVGFATGKFVDGTYNDV